MIKNLPTYIVVTFIVTTVITLLFFIGAMLNAKTTQTKNKATSIAILLVAWLTLQAVLTLNQVYISDLKAFPPKIMLFGVLPTILAMIVLFSTSAGRQFIDSLPLKNLAYLNIIRIPVEIVLFWLFLHKAIPQLMTFEGRNFDIIAGITAPFIVYFCFSKQKIQKNALLIWHFISLALLINIVVNALFSAPSPFQQFAFDQPNVAILHFPFSWLPTFIVPIVFLGHFTSIRQLYRMGRQGN